MTTLEGNINDEFVPTAKTFGVRIKTTSALIGQDTLSSVPDIGLQLNLYLEDGAFFQACATPSNTALETTGRSLFDNMVDICYFPYDSATPNVTPSLGNYIYSSTDGKSLTANPILDMSSFFEAGGEVEIQVNSTQIGTSLFAISNVTYLCNKMGAVIDLQSDPVLGKYAMLFSTNPMPPQAFGIKNTQGVTVPPPNPFFGWYRNDVSPVSLDMVGIGDASQVLDSAGAGTIEYYGLAPTGRTANYMTAENSNDYYSPVVKEPDGNYLQNWQAAKIPIEPTFTQPLPPRIPPSRSWIYWLRKQLWTL
jgi:hypothetical protein